MRRIANGPEWQDDLEVTSCFLCGSNYSIFYRRHHCRKCGRVVCGSCSERTVRYFPNTLIANPQGERELLTPYETYRSCDECVEEIKMIRRALHEADSGTMGSGGSGESTNIGENAAAEGPSSRNRVDDSDNNSTTKFSTRAITHIVDSSAHSSCANLNDRRRERSDSISDNNLCPVCTTDLLKDYIENHKKNKIDAENLESFKEKHINDCLIAFDFNQDHERAKSPIRGKTRSHKRNKMLVYNMPPIPKPQYETIPNVEGNSYDTIHFHAQPQQLQFSDLKQDNQGSLTTSNPNELVGSVNSNSTMQPGAEKLGAYELVDNECVICLEDLKPGDKVGRLECLCVFHYKCIKDWFNKKGYGECPVHFLHQ